MKNDTKGDLLEDKCRRWGGTETDADQSRVPRRMADEPISREPRFQVSADPCCQRGHLSNSAEVQGVGSEGNEQLNLVRTFYLDHQIFAREENWPIIRWVLDSQPSVRLVCSQWNLVEIDFGEDEGQRARRANFIDCLNPLWIMNLRDIQQAEVHRFVRSSYFRASVQSEVCAIVSDLGLTMASACMVVPGSLSAAKYVASHDPVSVVRNAVLPTPDVLRALQKAGTKKLQSIKTDSRRSWIAPLLPLCDDDGCLLSQQSQREILDFCIENWSALVASCPALDVESRLFEIRIRDPKRKPRVSDAADLQHAAAALAYCDHFVTADRFLFRCAAETRAAEPRFAQPHQSLDDLITVLNKGS
jgi:hypothetical protein